jgi:hypothetical protein
MENSERPFFDDSKIDDSLDNCQAFRDKEKDDNLSSFTPEQQREIESKRQILSSLAYFIGKDFKMPVELNKPGAGWHWDFKENVVRIDPKDLIEKPMDYLRFVISHEGGHRRISRTDFIPLETWKQPGFSFMMNAIEDPRDNNFVAEKYPTFRKQMDMAYQTDLDFEGKSKEKAQAKLGYQPRFMQAGFEYIKQWFKEQKDEKSAIDETLPEEVKEVINKTLESARSSWWTYPSPEEADQSEELISSYAEASYKMNLEKVWPEFQKLVEKDMEDQKTQELLKDMEQSKGEGQGLPQELKDNLSPQEQKELEDAIEKALEEAQKQDGQEDKDGKPQDGEPQKGGQPIDLDSLSDELKQKIKDYFDSLPEEKKQELQDKAQKIISEFEKDLNDEIEGKMSENPEAKSESKKETESLSEENKTPEAENDWQKREKEISNEQREQRKRMEAILETKEKNPYIEALIKTSDLIDNLTADLRDIFVKRKIEKHETGYRSGRRWNIRQRIREKVAGIPLFKTEAREQKESESEEMDYAITLMIDLSGSMQGSRKIQEAFKSAVVLSETLNNLGIHFEIVGFQDILLEFKSFSEHLDEPMRKKLNQLILEVNNSNPEGHNKAGDNDDGACLLEASKHLADQTAKNKFLVVISDGEPAMDSGKKNQSQLDRELKEAVAEITVNTNQKLIGIGLMSKAVAKYYENNIAGVTTEEMTETLGGLLREIVERY